MASAPSPLLHQEPFAPGMSQLREGEWMLPAQGCCGITDDALTSGNFSKDSWGPPEDLVSSAAIKAKGCVARCSLCPTKCIGWEWGRLSPARLRNCCLALCCCLGATAQALGSPVLAPSPAEPNTQQLEDPRPPAEGCSLVPGQMHHADPSCLDEEKLLPL